MDQSLLIRLEPTVCMSNTNCNKCCHYGGELINTTLAHPQIPLFSICHSFTVMCLVVFFVFFSEATNILFGPSLVCWTSQRRGFIRMFWLLSEMLFADNVTMSLCHNSYQFLLLHRRQLKCEKTRMCTKCFL